MDWWTMDMNILVKYGISGVKVLGNISYNSVMTEHDEMYKFDNKARRQCIYLHMWYIYKIYPTMK